MSFSAIQWALPHELPPTDKLVLVTLAYHYNDESGQCNPGIATLASETGMSERSVQRTIRRLESANYLRVTNPNGGRGNRMAVELLFDSEKGDIRDTKKGDKKGDNHDKTVTLVTPFEKGDKSKRVTNATQKGDTVSQKGDKCDMTIEERTVKNRNRTASERDDGKKDLPSRSTKNKPKRKTVIDDDFIERMVREYSVVLGGESAVRDNIDAALGHKAYEKWNDKQRYVMGWLRRSAERAPPQAQSPPTTQSLNGYKPGVTAADIEALEREWRERFAEE